MIPYGCQDVQEDDIRAVVEVLRSDWLTQGPKVPEFEGVLAEFTKAEHAVAVGNATEALHVACLALHLGPGSLLWTSPNTFVASANCGLYCGARVDFVDIDPRTYNMSTSALQEKLEQSERTGETPDVVVVVHHSGQPCDMAMIGSLAQRYGFRIIEDASHAVGAEFEAERVGGCRHSDIVVFSFHPVKIITTGEGGAALTNNDDLADRMRRLRSHGITRDPHSMKNLPDGAWYYEQIDLGFNYRMTDIQAALGVSQMTRLESYVSNRESLALRYDEFLATLPVKTPWQDSRTKSARHLYAIRLELERIGVSRKEIFDGLRASGIGANIHYIPVHLQPYYQDLGFKYGDFPEAERYYEEAISLPLFPTMTYDQQDAVVSALHHVLAVS